MIKKNMDDFRIMVKMHGDFSKILIGLNFMFCFHQYINDEKVKIYISGHRKKSVNDSIVKKQTFLAGYMTEKQWQTVEYKDYALVLDIDVYPEVLYCSEKVRENEKLYELVKIWKKFQLHPDNKLYYTNRQSSLPYVYTRLIIEKKTLLNSADLRGKLKIGTSYRLPVHFGLEKDEVLSKFQLQNQKFITIHHEKNPIFEELDYPKMWTLVYYEEFIRLMKEKYPEYTIVQLGKKHTEGETIPGVDLDLSGKVNPEELKVVLSQACLHIDGDSYMVHLRAYLHGGKSIVFYGPTPVELFSYPENINLSSGACNHWCAYLREDWAYRCIKNDTVDCMYGIQPERVMEAVEKCLDKRGTER